MHDKNSDTPPSSIPTEIAFVLDRSGSMSRVIESAIGGFNAFLADQQAQPGQARFTLVLFDDEYEVPADSIPVGEVTPLDTSSYVPRGMTALLDAVGLTINRLRERIAATPDTDRPEKVVIAILTDGLENASNEFDLAAVSALIKSQRDQHGWEFVFLGANQDAIASAVKMNIRADDAATFRHDDAGVRASARSASRKISSLRSRRATPDQAKSLREILDEEDSSSGSEAERK